MENNKQPQRQLTPLQASVNIIENAINMAQQNGVYSLKDATNIHLGLEQLKQILIQPKADKEILLKFGEFLMKHKGYKKEVTMEDIDAFAEQGTLKKVEKTNE